MTADSPKIRRERHAEVGAVIRRDAGLLIDRWSRQVVRENPQARRLHHEALRDDLPALLEAVGRSLAEEGEACHHCRPARAHGDQRWEDGWSIQEVVHDYQVLRVVLVEYLEGVLDRPLGSREVMALSLALDEAVATSVDAYSRSRDEALRETNLRRDEFLATLAHELRNPMTPVRNVIDLLERKDDPETVAWARGVLGRQLGLMTRLVDDLLDLSRIARGRLALRRERLDLADAVRAVAEDRRAAFTERGLQLTVETPSAPVWVDADAARLAQVVGNLLHNALKFTEAGGRVTVRVTAGPEGAEVAVADTGLGIAPADLPHVFDSFKHVGENAERSRGGLGLGLAIVKGLVGLHGGEVRAASPGPGRGTEFTVRLPLAPVPTAAAGAPARESDAAPLKILVVDDNRDGADSLKMLLALGGHEVIVAYSGAEAIEAARQHRPAVVLCDLGMPGTDGYAVAAALRRDPATAGARLIAISGFGSPGDVRRCQEAGFEAHLTKPVDPDDLRNLLAAPSADE